MQMNDNLDRDPLTDLAALRARLEETKRAPASAEGEARYYRMLFEQAPVPYQSLGADGRILDVGSTWLTMLGYSRDEVIGRYFADFLSPTHRDLFPERFAHFWDAGEVHDVQFDMVRKDGGSIPVSFDGRICRCEDGVVPRTHCIMRDLSQQKRAEVVAAESEERFRRIFDNSPLAFVVWSPDEHIREWNRRAEELFGWTRREMLGQSVLTLMTLEDRIRFVEQARRLINGGQREMITTGSVTKNGDVVSCEWRSTLLRDHGGLPVSILSMGLDVTDRVRAQEALRANEEELLRAQRLETAGRIAGQVAHDFNNLLAPLVAYPDMIKVELPEDSPAREYCDDMMEAAHQMAELNDDLLALARRGRLESGPVDVNGLVSHAANRMLDRPPTLAVDLALADDLLPAEGSASQLLRVLQNLISNARDAMRDIGTLAISTRNVYVDSATGVYNRVEQGEYVEVSVSDTGSGIPPTVRDRIFDAFFSTKKGSRRGCGLGLTVVQSIVEDHGGYIDLVSEEGLGTTFALFIPVSRGALLEAVEEQLMGHGEKILVVDDDPLQRSVASRALKALGYFPETACSGEEAVVCLADHAVDLVLLDMVMPEGMDGAETFRQILMNSPEQKALILSGYAESNRVKFAMELGAGGLLRKPVSVQQLATAVRHELNRR